MILSYIVPMLILAAVLWFLGWLAFRQIRFLIRGWMILGHGRDEIAYVERGKGRIVFYAELMGRGRIIRILYLPGEDDWNAKTPSWAQNRRDEIVKRIKQVCPESRYEYRRSE